jgi:hypothetical protein
MIPPCFKKKMIDLSDAVRKITTLDYPKLLLVKTPTAGKIVRQSNSPQSPALPLPAARALRSYAHKALGAGQVSAAIANGSI